MQSEQQTSTTLRIAFCIECHKYTPVLQELVEQLHHPENDIFIHVDNRSDIRAFAPLRDKALLIEPRAAVCWGGFGQIDCMLRLFGCTRQGDYRYIVLLSGDTILLRKCEEIRSFLADSYTKEMEFIEMESALNIMEIYTKVRKRHYYNKTSFALHLRHIIAKLCRPARNSHFKSIPPLQKGNNWIVFTDRFRDYIFDYLQAHPDYLKAFRHSLCCDEVFFHTILGNSSFRDKNTAHSLMFADWTHSNLHPKTHNTNDLHELAALRNQPGLPYLFARKIDDALDLAAYRAIVLPE